jgi:acetone monooxygenase
MQVREAGGPCHSVDAIVIGAGFAGLYQLHLLRKQGLDARILDAASGVGGTWYWNRYPGARTDSPSDVYQYLFSDELLAEWDWSERYNPQPETERYLNWVADKLGLRPNITFNTVVTEAHWDEAARRWTVRTDTGETWSARFVVACLGPLSAPVAPMFPGEESFKGRIVHTSRWPKEGVALEGKRVGVVGTGATGIQVIQTIAAEVGALTVFQRTANYAIPMRNPRFTEAEKRAMHESYPALKKKVWHTFAGFQWDFDTRNWSACSAEERREILEAYWADGSLKLWVGAFPEFLSDPAVNAEVSDFVREKIRARIKDPETAAKLSPTTHPFGTHRVPLENGYFEAFNRPNVRLVDVKADPITELTPTGVRTQSAEYPLDILILATGFDAVTGSITRIDVRGRDGRSLKELWARDLRTAMGMQVHGFPNLFLTSSPLTPGAAFCNAPVCIQHAVEWITECIARLGERGATRIEATAEFEEAWVRRHDEVASATLIAREKSWYTGANVEGKSSRLIGYPGVDDYRRACDEVKARDYEGFEIA